MTTTHEDMTRKFAVITGGRHDRAPVVTPLPRDPAPQLGAAQLAAEMAQLFTFALLAECPAEALEKPHLPVRSDGFTQFTLHDLLCELRNLPWFDHAADMTVARSDCSLSGSGDPDDDRALQWNTDGQLTLKTLFRGGIVHRTDRPHLSNLWTVDRSHAEPSVGLPMPDQSAAMSDWLAALESRCGAGLSLPGTSAQVAPIGTLADLACRVAQTPAGRPFLNVALAALAQNTAFDAGLTAPGNTDWPQGRLMHLMSKAEDLSTRTALGRINQPDRLSRPVVTAARISLCLNDEDLPSGAYASLIEDATAHLTGAAPALLACVARDNADGRRARRCPQSVFLPLDDAQVSDIHPADLTCHVVVAGALTTLIKAVFDTGYTGPHMVAHQPSGVALGIETDRMAGDVALARLVAGSHFPAENAQDLRIGQRIALMCLRDAMEQDNRSASLSFSDFDGQMVTLVAHPRGFGRGHVELRIDGTPCAWPQDTGPGARHLTAVV